MSIAYRPFHADATYDFKYGLRAIQGLGCPVFDKLEADLAKAMLSLPATKGFEFGSGFSGTFMTGSEHNDEFYMDEHGNMRTRTNRSGGIQGGISNGETISMRIAFKPTSTIGLFGWWKPW
ncbi:chorismate synthase 1, chloroplastic-like isoform X2 [Musa acuminata AAA Group]|uniref:chorismate synthase 1, chloroplastic-like isoform X2 n=1 Tax=Musa acuminata AAA Group TaxID=214697 RepID=UPI0031D5DD70